LIPHSVLCFSQPSVALGPFGFFAAALAVSGFSLLCCSLLQSVAVCFSLLQSAAVCCSLLQSVAVCVISLSWRVCGYPRSFWFLSLVLQSVAVCCSLLQCVSSVCLGSFAAAHTLSGFSFCRPRSRNLFLSRFVSLSLAQNADAPSLPMGWLRVVGSLK